MNWTLEQLHEKIRQLTVEIVNIGGPELTTKINDYYRNTFPAELRPEELKSWFTQATSVGDSGEYTVSTDIVLLDNPVTCNGVEIKLYLDAVNFFKKYPKDTGSAFCITDPTLVIGTTSKAAVRYSAFSYEIHGKSYEKAAGETALSGDNLPDGKVGVWRLEVDTDGTVSIVAAGANSTGYATPHLAVEGLSNESSTAACMGYVIVTNASGSVFDPGTTLLDADGLTVTYTDHFHSTRNTPESVLLSGGILYCGPKADDIYQIKAREIQKPTALVAEATVTVPQWGPVVAWGTSIEILLSESTQDSLAKAALILPVYEHYKILVNRKKLIQMTRNQRVTPRF